MFPVTCNGEMKMKFNKLIGIVKMAGVVILTTGVANAGLIGAGSVPLYFIDGDAIKWAFGSGVAEDPGAYQAPILFDPQISSSDGNSILATIS